MLEYFFTCTIAINLVPALSAGVAPSVSQFKLVWRPVLYPPTVKDKRVRLCPLAVSSSTDGKVRGSFISLHRKWRHVDRHNTLILEVSAHTGPPCTHLDPAECRRRLTWRVKLVSHSSNWCVQSVFLRIVIVRQQSYHIIKWVNDAEWSGRSWLCSQSEERNPTRSRLRATLIHFVCCFVCILQFKQI